MSTAVATPKGNGARTTIPAAKPAEKPAGEALLDQVVTNTESKWTRPTAYRPFGSDEEITLTAGIVMQFLCKPTKNGSKPSLEDCVKFVLLCKSRKLNPWVGDAFMVGYDGKDGPEFNLITAHQTFLKRAETHKEYDGMTSGVIVSNGEEIIEMEGDFFPDGYTLLGGWATVYFKSRSHPMRKRLKLGTFNKGRSVWQSNPAGMIVKCAEADALRSSFPTELGGLYLQGELPSDDPVVPTQPATAAAKQQPANRVASLTAKILNNGQRQAEATQSSYEPTDDEAASEQAKPSESWELSTRDQHDEIDMLMERSGWIEREVLAGYKASDGSPITARSQMSKAQASDVMRRMDKAISEKGE